MMSPYKFPLFPVLLLLGSKAPAIENKIPIWIRNTFNPSCPGTRIGEKSGSSHMVKGFATVDGMVLVNVEAVGRKRACCSRYSTCYATASKQARKPSRVKN